MISVVATDTVDAIDGEKYILLAGNRHDCLRSRSKNKHENSLYQKKIPPQKRCLEAGHNKNGIRAYINNIYAIGDYFFLDYTLKNKTRIAYDIEEIRVKLTDKKETKATNSQTIELTPVFSMNNTRKFRKDYRNVLVLPKLTFPEEKVLRLEISENQISGRVVVLTIEYEDILNADGFDSDILDGADYYPYYYIDHSIKR